MIKLIKIIIYCGDYLRSSLILKGREVLGRLEFLGSIWSNVYEPFFSIIYFDNYRNESMLLNKLLRWASSLKRFSYKTDDVTVFSRVFYTHQHYVRTSKRGRREFGDVSFLTLFSRSDERIGYVNTFQLKVSSNISSLLKNINRSQLDFYRFDFTMRILNNVDKILICDFLWYWMVLNVKPRILFEIPLSFMWIKDPYKSIMLHDFPYSKLSFYQSLSIMLRNLLLVTGISVEEVLSYATPRLRDLLYLLLKFGVKDLPMKLHQFNGGEGFPPNKELPKPEFPIGSSIVIATEVSIKE